MGRTQKYTAPSIPRPASEKSVKIYKIYINTIGKIGNTKKSNGNNFIQSFIIT